ncbi:terminase small subunit [Clostridium botulinum]|uniref:terminase small subunit n=1 Tax=Clostridium botulinum TaxID=1491 RepID=UPI000774C9AD|nr:terminase small subunit [Clostridium botulinum]MBY6932294.1 hypothetical protein [Clostridium botulinum]NFG22196.1 hypothetical protein [Clostridium botulinum]NFO82712.1 hypothetical protein [Clostridium botulinum]
MKYRGRPAKYENPEDMQKLIVEYFEECNREHKRPTVSGLAYVIGTDRKTLLRYENADECNWLKQYDKSVRDGFRNTIKDAKRYIESQYEDGLINDGKTPIGLIFTLKNNYGWVDKQEIVNTNNNIEVKLED